MVGLAEKQFKKGQIICRDGDLDATMYNILYGRAAVYTGKHTTGAAAVAAGDLRSMSPQLYRQSSFCALSSFRYGGSGG